MAELWRTVCWNALLYPNLFYGFNQLLDVRKLPVKLGLINHHSLTGHLVVTRR